MHHHFVYWTQISAALEERQEFLEKVERGHSDFNSLIDGLTTSYLSLEKQIKLRSDLGFDSVGNLSDELDSFQGIQKNNAHNEQKIESELESLKDFVESDDLEDLEDRRNECKKLGNRINQILAARSECVDFLENLKEQIGPISADIEEMEKKSKNSEINTKETLDRCNMLGVELVDCLKLATQVDLKAQTGQLHFSNGSHTSV